MIKFVTLFPLVMQGIVGFSVLSNLFWPLDEWVRASVFLYLVSIGVFGAWIFIKKSEPLGKKEVA
jgi:hypothetical protein